MVAGSLLREGRRMHFFSLWDEKVRWRGNIASNPLTGTRIWPRFIFVLYFPRNLTHTFHKPWKLTCNIGTRLVPKIFIICVKNKRLLIIPGHLLPPVQLQVDDPQEPRDACPVLVPLPPLQRPADRRLPREDPPLLHGGVAAQLGGKSEWAFIHSYISLVILLSIMRKSISQTETSVPHFFQKCLRQKQKRKETHKPFVLIDDRCVCLIPRSCVCVCWQISR